MIKTKTARIKKQIENFLFDHYIIKTVFEYIRGFFIAAIAAIVFAFGFSCFISPSTQGGFILATGGVSGVSQIIAWIVETIRGEPVGNNLIQSIGYTLLNVPLLIFSFFKLGKRFTIFTLVNVVLSSVFISLFSTAHVGEHWRRLALSWHSHTTSTCHPAACRAATLRASRSRFRSIFSCQNRALVDGRRSLWQS